MIVVSNASPIINLARIGRLALLQQLYQRLVMPDLAAFPHLAAPQTWGAVTCRFALDPAPAPARIANVNCVPFQGDHCVLIRLTGGAWEIPGGTLEPGEDYRDAVRREVREEAGAALHTFLPFGAWGCRSTAATPYRPHLPHPDFYRLVGYGEVTLEGAPLAVAGGEVVAAVALLPVPAAAARFAAAGRPDLADLYRLAALLRGRQVGDAG